MATTKLNERQLTVLRRIYDSQTPVTSDDSHLATTVYALRNRGLVATPRAGGRWSAELTEAGRQHLKRTDCTTHHPIPTAPVSPTKAEAAELITRLQQGDGTVRITDPAPGERARWRQILHTARADRMVPEGHYLRHTGRDRGDMVITLHPGSRPARSIPPDEAVPVPDDLPPERLHPVAAQAPVPVCPDCLPRARRILHALCRAAEDNNYTVGIPASGSRGSLVVTVADSSFPLFFREGSYEAPDPSGAKYAWQRVTAQTVHPSHQLELHLEHTYGHPGRQSCWGDRQRWRLEDRLPNLFREITHRAHTEAERRLARQRKEEETRQRWLAAMRQARTALAEDHRTKILRGQVQAWQEATAVRAYCDALEDQQNATAGTTHATRAWIEWARTYADCIDPALQSPELPQPPTATPENLRPHLHGWSPYEPKRA
ncbi:hypothetical protein ACIRL3_15605 [Streptomyces sp. NPDC102384]|uniref:hypothetical protein n=1 Tax=Streptomyces sp. NPDC102384 TaxID=3366166 RepID=UPI0038189EFD